MSLIAVRRAVVAGVVFAALYLVPALPAQATTAGPTVVAVHRNGAVDIPYNTFGTIAKLSLGAGNWLITATGNIQGAGGAVATYCELVAGSDTYTSRADPTNTGPGSRAAMTLLLGHHFAKSGSVQLKCQNNGWTGYELIRDVHVTAVRIGTLTGGDVVYGSGTPVALYQQGASQHLYQDAAYHQVQGMTLGAGTWLIQAAATAVGSNNGDRVDCSLTSSSTTTDMAFEDIETGAGRTVGLEGVLTLTSSDTVSIMCKDTAAGWQIQGSAISALKVGTLKYGHFGSTMTTTGSGSPTVVGAYSDDAGAVAVNQTPQAIASMTLGSGNWFATSHVSLIDGYPALVNCQLQVGSSADQGPVWLDSSAYSLGWTGSSLTKKLSGSSKATIACGQSGVANDVVFLHDKIFAIKAGSLTDTALN